MKITGLRKAESVLQPGPSSVSNLDPIGFVQWKMWTVEAAKRYSGPWPLALAKISYYCDLSGSLAVNLAMGRT